MLLLHRKEKRKLKIRADLKRRSMKPVMLMKARRRKTNPLPQKEIH